MSVVAPVGRPVVPVSGAVGRHRQARGLAVSRTCGLEDEPMLIDGALGRPDLVGGAS